MRRGLLTPVDRGHGGRIRGLVPIEVASEGFLSRSMDYLTALGRQLVRGEDIVPVIP